MKLIFFLLFLEFIYVQSYHTYSIDGELKKYGSKTLYNDRTFRCLYLDLNNFKDDKTLYFIIKIHYGYFTENKMWYGTDNSYTGSTRTLYNTETYYSESYGTRTTYTGSYYYDYHTYRFKLDKPTNGDRYLYIGHPDASTYTGYYIEIENVSGFGLSVAVIVIIVIAIIAIVAASIIVYFCRRARRASYIAPPVAEYQPPVAAATAYPPPTYY